MRLLNSCLLALILLGPFVSVLGQTSRQMVDIKKELYNLREYSIVLDTYKKFPKNGSVYFSKRDSVETLYRNQIHKIKRGPLKGQFLAFLTVAVQKDSAHYNKISGFNYTYIDEALSIRRSELPTLLEYFKVVKYSLFDQDKEKLLPPDQIPFLSYKKKPKLMMRKLDDTKRQ